jgi:hypothetical protein
VASPSSLIALVAAASVASIAHAESREPAGPALPKPAYVRMPGLARTTSGPANVTSRIVYLNRCLGGCAVTQGSDDSRTNTSSIASGQRVLPEFSRGDEVWAGVVACVKKTFEPFDLTITDVDPGNTPHFENIVAGRISDLTSSPDLQGAGGVAPFDCGEIPNAIVYTFDVYGPNVDQLCWTSAQEIAHAFGLEHQLLTKDPMTYLGGDLPKRFRDEEAQCGEYQPRGCDCGGLTQNSYRQIVDLFGFGAPTPPEVAIKYPRDGRVVQPGFTVTTDAQDDVRVERVELYIDGALAGMSSMQVARVFDIQPGEVAAGPHTLEVHAFDVQGVQGNSAPITVEMGPPWTASSGCEDPDVCVEGVCLPGPDEPGGLGAICQSETECLSHRCEDAGEPFKHCVEECGPDNPGSCPSEFKCLAAGATGVCWPSPGGGCCDAGTAPQGSILLGLGLGALLVRRRRRG